MSMQSSQLTQKKPDIRYDAFHAKMNELNDTFTKSRNTLTIQKALDTILSTFSDILLPGARMNPKAIREYNILAIPCGVETLSLSSNPRVNEALALITKAPETAQQILNDEVTELPAVPPEGHEAPQSSWIWGVLAVIRETAVTAYTSVTNAMSYYAGLNMSEREEVKMILIARQNDEVEEKKE